MNTTKEDVIDIPLENTPFNLFLYSDDWEQDGIAPKNIVCAGAVEDMNLSYMLYCDKSALNNFINGKKKEFAKSYGYNYWGEIVKQQDKHTLDKLTSEFIKKLFV